ncbi:MAG: sporulation protein YunB [Bacilli bacterium]|nr:sporulation protein YunB [Bacillales bacterium]MDY2574364.1 sporulation protein YunB [Bacilli bacterium]
MRISFLTRVTFTLIILITSVSFFFSYIKKGVNETYESLALVQSKSLVTRIVNQVVFDRLQTSDFNISYSKEEYVSYDVNQLNSLVGSLSSYVVNVLENINNSDYSSLMDSSLQKKYNCSGIVFEMEFGKIYNSIFFSFLGNKYPVKFTLASDVLASSDMVVEEFGINNALVSLNMLLSFDFSLILPLTKKLDKIDIKIPLSIMMIEGEVPSYLFGSHYIEGASSYVIEVEEI